ncbi:ubiquitin-conjugating enzyme/RWD-like protein [Artemisia annua]|uniref:Ubiquitin-conjugating enzyme/RWD-like protein n=1 Tax=Artemisia annua TaxID=35608 RepID=A0A2U1NJ61_ARTAN|nr:ubiquitin-conjugating enzyme/RWD-like protein [Artemisia annua]
MYLKHFFTSFFCLVAYTIYVRVYESRLDLLKAVIVGPKGTPYHNGLFFFDICLPSNYPISPPVVRYHFAGLGISPNLTSSCGIVRLSLPKTNGDLEHVWVPGTSTILQLLVSIQDLIFNSHPFFNGYKTARMRGSVDGERYSLLYNENTIRKTLKTMVYTMKNPPKVKS